MSVTPDDVRAILNGLSLPVGGSLGGSGRVGEIVANDGVVMFAIAIDATEAAAMEPVRLAAERAVLAVPGVSKAFVSLTAERPAPRAQRPPAAAMRGAGIPGVERIIAVASGKGGVGKSTTAANLALGLAALGLRVGILDADIYGPSLPKLFGISGKPNLLEGRVLEPMQAYGLKLMSIGFLVEEDTAMIWRGPMVISAITQMLREVAWGELDILVVDMPPGTGDAQLTMAQQVPLAGAVIVSTPQDLALIDARRGVAMFQKVNVPILGIVENMSHFLCPHCGQRSDIFGHGGARKEAERLEVPFLGEVPLAMTIRETSDSGRPLVATDPGGPHARAYVAIAAAVLDRLNSGAGLGPAPRIIIE